MAKRYVVVVRGPALAGKSSVARRLAERLPGKAALLSQDDLESRWIVGHDANFAAESELVYRQIKLLAASYVRGGYHMVIEGAFAAYRDGVAVRHDSDLRELLSLMATIPNVQPLFVTVTAPLDVLLARARESEGWDSGAVEALHAAFEKDALPSPLIIDTSVTRPGEAAAQVLAHLRG
jgi:chloramphenicol 3-O-phosphotransferase